MSITPEGLQELDLGAIEEYRDAWERLARHVDETAEDIDKVRNKTLSEENFDGYAAEESRAELKWTAKDFDEAQEQASGMASLLDNTIEELRDCQTEVNRIYEEVHALGLKVDSNNGLVTASGSSNDRAIFSTEATTLHRDLVNVLDRAQEAQDNLQAELADTVGTPETWRPGPNNMGEYHQEQLEAMVEAGASPEAINEWWESLPSMQQQDTLETAPGLLGGTDGIPSDIRDTANRTTLDSDINKLDDKLDQINQAIADLPDSAKPEHGHPHNNYGSSEYRDLMERKEGIESELADLERLQDRIGPAPEDLGGNKPANASEAPHYLIDYGVEGDGTAVVAVGNPDEADNTAVYVPGTGSDLQGAGGDIERAQHMWNDALNADDNSDTAVIAWVDYDAPSGLNDARDESYAEEASDNLNQFMDGIHATHSEQDGARTTLLGHSYGSTVIGQTAIDHDLNVDQIVGVGSPGKIVDDADGLGIGAENVWTTRAGLDLISVAAKRDWIHGANPTGEDFGGNVFGSDSTGEDLMGVHSGYWDEENSARRNMAYIITGQGGQIDTL